MLHNPQAIEYISQASNLMTEKATLHWELFDWATTLGIAVEKRGKKFAVEVTKLDKPEEPAKLLDNWLMEN